MSTLNKFTPFSATHACTLLCVALVIWLAVALTRKQAQTGAPTVFERTLAYANLALWLVYHGTGQMSGRFDAVATLPLQMCHVTTLVASGVLLTGHATLRAVLYFWAFALCTQAMITPSLIDPPSSPVFWTFWLLHGMVMLIAVYDIAVRGFRPTWRDYRVACVAGLTYMAVVLPINIWLGANYGFLGNSRALHPSIVDLLGPWPQRLLIIVPLAATAMALAMVPWVALQQTAKLGRPRGAS